MERCPTDGCRNARLMLPSGEYMMQCYQHLADAQRGEYRQAMGMGRKCVSRVISVPDRKWLVFVQGGQINVEDYGARPQQRVVITTGVAGLAQLRDRMEENVETRRDKELLFTTAERLVAEWERVP